MCSGSSLAAQSDENRDLQIKQCNVLQVMPSQTGSQTGTYVCIGLAPQNKQQAAKCRKLGMASLSYRH